ncbi:MAG: class I SAM-dependent methyltransferase [Flavobacteriaceae bacterium]
MINQIKKYFKFIRQSTTKYGVHSPFVFDLITNCLEKLTPSKKVEVFNQYKQFLLQNALKINVIDFGAGSRVFSSNHRKIAAIAKNAGIHQKRAELLMRLVAYFKSSEILEIGTSLGLGTLALALGNENATITTLEGCRETVDIPKTQLHKYVNNRIHFKVGEFKETLAFALENKKYDLIYLDGNHQKKATIDYFEQCLKATHNDSVLIFDDIHWSKEMTEAWEIIKTHPKVTLTLDTFFWGFVFLRQEQHQKEHFIIRI